jgi:hypothetical protein
VSSSSSSSIKKKKKKKKNNNNNNNNIPCHDRDHIIVILVLQSCTDPLRVLPGSSSETFPTSSDCTYDYGNIKVEEDVDVIGESFIAINKEVDIGMKQEEIPEEATFSGLQAEPDEVSNVCCMSVIGHILPVSSNAFPPHISVQFKQLHGWE